MRIRNLPRQPKLCDMRHVRGRHILRVDRSVLCHRLPLGKLLFGRRSGDRTVCFGNLLRKFFKPVLVLPRKHLPAQRWVERVFGVPRW